MSRSSAMRGRAAWLAIARRPWLSALLVALLSFGGSAGVSLGLGMPFPNVHDEFSYLLAADTFARGRLTNPPHPMRVHFETFHVIQEPTYQSKYPPAQGLILALGQVVGGHPIVGIWLGSAMLCGALTWVLRGWVPPRWALLGGVLTALQFGIVGHWAQDYFGGAVAATGGVLLFGSLRRILRSPSVGAALLMGLGIVILANSRPFEGLLACVPAAVLMAAWMVRRAGAPVRVRLLRVGLPIIAVLAVGAAAMLAYNRAVTHDPLVMPYVVHESTYAVCPLFLWGTPGEAPDYTHERIRDFQFDWSLHRFNMQQTLAGYSKRLYHKLSAMAWRSLGPVLWLPLLVALPLVRHGGWPLLAVVVIAMMIVSAAVSTFYASHYVAPMTILVVFLIVSGVRVLRAGRGPGRAVRRRIAPAVVALTLLSLVPALVGHRAHVVGSGDWGLLRVEMERDFADQGGRHLVLVHYDKEVSVLSEWVYNLAEIDEQPAVWARDMGPAGNRDLLAYYADRQVWRLSLRASGTAEIERVRR